MRSVDAKQPTSTKESVEEKDPKKSGSSLEAYRSRVKTTFESQYKITYFPSRVYVKGRVSFALYLPSGICDGIVQGKMRLKVVELGKYLEAPLLCPATSQNIKQFDQKKCMNHKEQSWRTGKLLG